MLRVYFLMLGCAGLSACGLKGPLYLPESDKPAEVAPAADASPPGAAAPSSTESDDDDVDTQRRTGAPE